MTRIVAIAELLVSPSGTKPF